MQALSLAPRPGKGKRSSTPAAPNIGKPAGKLFQWREALLEYGPHSTVTRAVALVVSASMNIDGGLDGKCFPSYARIARRAAIKPRAAKKHVADLVSAGWLNRHVRREAKGENRRQTSNYYVAAYPPGFDAAALGLAAQTVEVPF